MTFEEVIIYAEPVLTALGVPIMVVAIVAVADDLIWLIRKAVVFRGSDD